MSRHSVAYTFVSMGVDRGSDVPLHLQLYQSVQKSILSGTLVPGTRLPSTRALADELGISRNTIVAAFEQLLAEGYVEARVGSGTHVAHALPDQPQKLLRRLSEPDRRQDASDRSHRARAKSTPVAAARLRPAARAFRPGVPALDALPVRTLGKIAANRWRHSSSQLVDYGDPAGYRPLREAIAAYLGAARGVHCEAGQVIVVAGSQQALNLATRLLVEPGDDVLFEDPGYIGARAAFLSAGARLVPVPVDEQGIDIGRASRTNPRARLVYVTPSHQYPLGVTMSLTRRLALLDWARSSGSLVLEDDYDSEFRYAGRPLPALQGLGGANEVIYIGTFSKVLYPSLRLGYMVVPPDLVDAFIAARAVADRHSPLLEQAVLADFMSEGHFARHIRRMRTLYAERQAALIAAAQHELGPLLEVQPAEAGMHLVGWLPDGVDDVAASCSAAEGGIEAPALSRYSLGGFSGKGLLLGYTGVDSLDMRVQVRRLASALRA